MNVKNMKQRISHCQKRGVASISWILTIVFMLAVMGIMWLAVEPATSGLSSETEEQIDDTSAALLEKADISDMHDNN